MVNLEEIPSVGSLVYEFFLRRNSKLAARIKKELQVGKPAENSPTIEQIWSDWLESQRSKKKTEDSSSSEDSSSEEKPSLPVAVSPRKVVGTPNTIKKIPEPTKKVVKQESDSSESSEDEAPVQKPKVVPQAVQTAKPSETSSDESDEGTPLNTKTVTKKPEPKKESSSSDTSDDDEPPSRTTVSPPKPAVTPVKTEVKEEDSSDSSSEDEAPSTVLKTPAVAVKKEESSDDSSSEDEPAAPVVTKPVVNGISSAAKTKDSSDSSSSDDDESAPKTTAEVTAPKINGKSNITAKAAESSDSSSSEEEEPKQKPAVHKPVPFVPASDSKKRKMNGDGDIPEKKVKHVDEPVANLDKKGKKKPNVPFKRIPDHVTSTTPGLNDNSFESKQGFDEWGSKANKSLSAVKGKNFKKEKTKKKRGSYAGGAINTGVNSFKFD